MTDVPEKSSASGEFEIELSVCDGAGGSRRVTVEEAREPLAPPEWLWVHLNHMDPEHARWLRETSGLDPVTCDALLEEETRPRLVACGDNAMVFLRGVNLNPGAEPDDMISLRLWIESGRLISIRRRRLQAVQDLRDRFAKRTGPLSPGGFLVAMTDRLLARQANVVDSLEDTVDAVEELMVTEPGYALRTRIAEFRRQAIGLRRYIAPQREVLTSLVHEHFPWLSDSLRARLRECGDRQIRLVEEVDSARERAGVAQEELNGRLSEQMNRNMYVLSLVAGVFLPLGLLTGLLGINVGGMPGVDSADAFWIVCVLLGVVAVFVVWLFRRIRLL